MSTPLSDSALDQLFREARSLHTFIDRAVTDETLQQLYGLARLGPTGFNSQPARFVFVRSAAEKQRLAPTLSSGNREKTVLAPVTAIVAHDSRFYEHLPVLFPAYDAQPMFLQSAALAQQTAERNCALQAAYLIIAARALGLDAGPMSGFKEAEVNRLYFPDGRYRAMFLINLGYAERTSVRPRGPRLSFEEAASIL